MTNVLSIVFGFLGVICFLSTIGVGCYVYYIGYQYERDIGSYMGNAIDMVAPEGMLEQVQLSKNAMINAGLTEEDYGAWIFKKPDNSMKFQYQHIDGIIERINSVIDWKDKAYGENSTTTESLGDVYEQKMTNLRQYIKGETMEGSVGGDRSDWIAEDTWWLKKHFFMNIFGWLIELILLILSIIFIMLAGASWE